MQDSFIVQSLRPGSPFLGWPIQLYDPRFGYAWYTSPAVFVSHLDVTRGDADTAIGINDAMDRVIAARADEIRAAGGLLVLQDFRSATSYTSEARQLFVDRLRQRPRGYSRGVYVAVGVNPLLRMAIQTANLAFSIFIGGSVQIVDDPTDVLERFRVQPPERNATFPE